MTVQNLLIQAKELADEGKSQESLAIYEVARKQVKNEKYEGKEIIGFKLVEKVKEPVKPQEVKSNGKKPKR